MAVTLDAVASDNTTGTSSTISITVSASATLMTVDVGRGTGSTVTGVTFNGVALTQLATINADPDFNKRADTWYLANPAAGLHNVVVSYDATTNPGVVVRTWIGAASPPADAHTVKQATTTSFSGTAIASTTSSMVVDFQTADDVTITNGSSQTTDGDLTDASGARRHRPTHKVGDASVTLSYTYGLSTPLVWIGYSIDQIGGGGQTIGPNAGNIASEENVPQPEFSQTGQINNAGDIASSESVSTPTLSQPNSIQVTTSIAGAEAELHDLVLETATFGAADPDPQFTQYRLTLRNGPDPRTAFAPLGTDFTLYRAFTQVLPGSYVFRLELSNSDGSVVGPGVSKVVAIGAFGTADIGIGISQVVSIASSEAVPNPTLTADVALVGIGNIASLEVVSTPTFTTDDVVIPVSIPSAEAFSTPSFVIEGVIAPLSIPSAESVSIPSIATAGGAQTIGPNAGDIASAESVSIPVIAGDIILTAVGDIASAEAVSIPTVSTEGVILPLSIASEESVPQPGIVQAGEITGAGDIASAESVSIPAIGEDRQILSVGNISSEENVPAPSVFEGRAILDAGDIASDEDFEDPDLVTASVIAPNSIASEEAFGALITSGAGGTGFRFKVKARKRVFVVRRRH